MVGRNLATCIQDRYIYSNPIFPNLSRLIFQYVLSQSANAMQSNGDVAGKLQTTIAGSAHSTPSAAIR